MNYIKQIVEKKKKKRILKDTLDMCMFFLANRRKYMNYIRVLKQSLDYSISGSNNVINEINNELSSISKFYDESNEKIKEIEEKNYNAKESFRRVHYPYYLKENENNQKKSFIMKLFEFITRKKIKCKRFYNAKSRTVDFDGLKVALSQEYEVDLGSFKVDTQYQNASEALQKLDLLQFNLCNLINGINDTNLRDNELRKVIGIQGKMMELTLKLEAEKEDCQPLTDMEHV